MTILDRLQRFMQAHSHTNVRLNPPASLEQVEAAEAAMHVKLPADVRTAYLRFNGVKRDVATGVGPTRPRGPALFVGLYDWVDLDRMVKHWRTLKGMEAEMRESGAWQDVALSQVPPHRKAHPLDWHPKWIPIGDSGHFDAVYIDLAPAKAGKRGQIVYGGRGFGPHVSADGFGNYLERLLDGVDSGKLVLDSENFWQTPSGAVVTKLADAGA